MSSQVPKYKVVQKKFCQLNDREEFLYKGLEWRKNRDNYATCPSFQAPIGFLGNEVVEVLEKIEESEKDE